MGQQGRVSGACRLQSGRPSHRRHSRRSHLPRQAAGSGQGHRDVPGLGSGGNGHAAGRGARLRHPGSLHDLDGARPRPARHAHPLPDARADLRKRARSRRLGHLRRWQAGRARPDQRGLERRGHRAVVPAAGRQPYRRQPSVLGGGDVRRRGRGAFGLRRRRDRLRRSRQGRARAGHGRPHRLLRLRAAQVPAARRPAHRARDVQPHRFDAQAGSVLGVVDRRGVRVDVPIRHHDLRAAAAADGRPLQPRGPGRLQPCRAGQHDPRARVGRAQPRLLEGGGEIDPAGHVGRRRRHLAWRPGRPHRLRLDRPATFTAGAGWGSA